MDFIQLSERFSVFIFFILKQVTPDIANHFSESAIKQRNLERLTLQGLERERKREENRGKKGTER